MRGIFNECGDVTINFENSVYSLNVKSAYYIEQERQCVKNFLTCSISLSPHQNTIQSLDIVLELLYERGSFQVRIPEWPYSHMNMSPASTGVSPPPSSLPDNRQTPGRNPQHFYRYYALMPKLMLSPATHARRQLPFSQTRQTSTLPPLSPDEKRTNRSYSRDFNSMSLGKDTSNEEISQYEEAFFLSRKNQGGVLVGVSFPAFRGDSQKPWYHFLSKQLQRLFEDTGVTTTYVQSARWLQEQTIANYIMQHIHPLDLIRATGVRVEAVPTSSAKANYAAK